MTFPPQKWNKKGKHIINQVIEFISNYVYTYTHLKTIWIKPIVPIYTYIHRKTDPPPLFVDPFGDGDGRAMAAVAHAAPSPCVAGSASGAAGLWRLVEQCLVSIPPNGGFLTWGVPQNHPKVSKNGKSRGLGYSYFRKPPNGFQMACVFNRENWREISDDSCVALLEFFLFWDEL